MTTPPVRTRSFVMVLLGWCAFASAPVVALCPPLAAAFFVLAMGLVAVVTLRFTLLSGGTAALLAAALFALVLAAGPAPATAVGPEQLGRMVAALGRSQTLVPALLGAAALGGAAVFGDLASAGLEWDQFARSIAPVPHAVEPEKEPESEPEHETPTRPRPSPPVPNGRAPRETRIRRTARRAGHPTTEDEEDDDTA